ncbi:hypothetical protein O0L34_g13792 [Tuta absoluta]|nr:hypothetical protein O0L34_g13792 [Tuta absoluta]
MENMEEIFHFLEDFSKRKPKVIPPELNEYLAHVARTGDPVYQWSLVKCLFKEKLLNVITEFYETTPSIEIPPYPNVDPFNYDTMKNSLLERLDSFSSAPFTVQRICELLAFPRKQYNRVDKFMRAVEKNILVVSTREPGPQRHAEPENGEPAEPIVNGSDNNSEYNVDVEMEDMSWKENAEQQQPAEPQPSSSDTHISVDDIEARLNAKQDATMQDQDKAPTEYESVTPPELNVATDEQEMKSGEQEVKPNDEGIKTSESSAPTTTETVEHVEVSEKMDDTTSAKIEGTTEQTTSEESKVDVEMKPVEQEIESAKDPLIIPEIKVDDADMTEQRLAEESKTPVETEVKETPSVQEPGQEQSIPVEDKPLVEEKVEDKPLLVEDVEEKPLPVQGIAPPAIDENSSDTTVKDEPESKLQPEIFSEESQSSSSDNTDGNSNSPKIEPQSDSLESSSDANLADTESTTEEPQADTPHIETDNYSISDVKSELPQPTAATASETEEIGKGEPAPQGPQEDKNDVQELKKEEESKEKTETPVTSEVCSEN